MDLSTSYEKRFNKRGKRMKHTKELNTKDKEVFERSRAMHIQGLNHGVIIGSDYPEDDLDKLGKYAVKLYRQLIKIEKEER